MIELQLANRGKWWASRGAESAGLHQQMVIHKNLHEASTSPSRNDFRGAYSTSRSTVSVTPNLQVRNSNVVLGRRDRAIVGFRNVMENGRCTVRMYRLVGLCGGMLLIELLWSAAAETAVSSHSQV